jgi:hypothetical protein
MLNGSSTPYGPTLCSTLLSPVSWLANGASIYIVKVSLSNDGAGWSNSVTYTVYDSHCFTCDDNGCQKKTSFTDQGEAQRCNTALSYGSLCNFDNNNYCVPNSCTSSTIRETPSPPISCWEAILNSNVPYGIGQPSARNLADCQNQCLAAQLTSCPYGFDFNPSNQPGDQCFFSTSNNVLYNSYPGVVHYRYTCGRTFVAPTTTAPTTTPPTTTPPTTTLPITTPPSTQPFIGAVGCWNVFNNSNSPGGTAQQQYNTLTDCGINCFLNSCIGFDWNPQNPSGQQCWFSRSDVINYNSYSGCIHYQRKPCP